MMHESIWKSMARISMISPAADSDIVQLQTHYNIDIFTPHSQTTSSSVSPNSVITNLREEILPSSRPATLSEDNDNLPNQGLITYPGFGDNIELRSCQPE